MSDITGRPEPADQVKYSDLEFGEKVGLGGFGSVSKGRWKSREMVVAIKTLNVFDEREVSYILSCNVRIVTIFLLDIVWAGCENPSVGPFLLF